jgi:hypothetical protein
MSKPSTLSLAAASQLVSGKPEEEMISTPCHCNPFPGGLHACSKEESILHSPQYCLSAPLCFSLPTLFLASWTTHSRLIIHATNTQQQEKEAT